jgi:hypothetical protein
MPPASARTDLQPGTSLRSRTRSSPDPPPFPHRSWPSRSFQAARAPWPENHSIALTPIERGTDLPISDHPKQPGIVDDEPGYSSETGVRGHPAQSRQNKHPYAALINVVRQLSQSHSNIHREKDWNLHRTLLYLLHRAATLLFELRTSGTNVVSTNKCCESNFAARGLIDYSCPLVRAAGIDP